MKKYILKYHNYGFKAGSIYTHEGEHLIHRDENGEIVHKILESQAYAGDFQDTDHIDEHKLHRDLINQLINKTLHIKLSNIGLGRWWWEGRYLPYKLIEDNSEQGNIYALVPQWNGEVEDSAHKMLTTLGLKFIDGNYGKYQTLRDDFEAWFNGLMEKTFIGSINFYINDVKSIEHTSEKITSITLVNDTKILISY